MKLLSRYRGAGGFLSDFLECLAFCDEGYIENRQG